MMGRYEWEDFFHEEFIPEIENKYRIIGTRNTRTIAGLSMGGYGALYHGVKYKENFSAVYAMSGAFLEVESMPESERSDWDRDFHLKTWGPYNEEGLPENKKGWETVQIIIFLALGENLINAELK